MQAFVYFPQCYLICCGRFLQLYLEAIRQLPLQLKSIWHFSLLTILSIFSLLIGLVHITFVFGERIFFSWLIKKPKNSYVYIIGAPRSGTTRLHKLTASDEEKFTAMQMWEMFFAPSIIQKKAFAILGKIDSIFNSIFSRAIQKIEKFSFSKFNTIHSLSLFNVEEDALVLFHLFYSYHLSFLLGTEKSYADLNKNEKIPKAVWIYYKYCIENHQLQNPGKIYLAKNPFFTAHTSTLKELFPDIKFVNLKRDIQEVAPSFFSMKKHLSNVFYGYNPSNKKYKEILNTLKYWQECGAKLPTSNTLQLAYTDLKEKPSSSVSKIYTFLQLDSSKKHQDSLLVEEEKSKNYISKHKYKLEDFFTESL